MVDCGQPSIWNQTAGTLATVVLPQETTTTDAGLHRQVKVVRLLRSGLHREVETQLNSVGQPLAPVCDRCSQGGCAACVAIAGTMCTHNKAVGGLDDSLQAPWLPLCAPLAPTGWWRTSMHRSTPTARHSCSRTPHPSVTQAQALPPRSAFKLAHPS